MTSVLAQTALADRLPLWTSSTVIAGSIAGALALGGVFIGKWLERGIADIDRKERRRQSLFDAYAAWLTSFEVALQDNAAYYGPIAWEHEHGPGSTAKCADTKPIEGPTAEQQFKMNSWKLRLLERDALLASEIEALSHAFDYDPQDYSDLVGQALGWPAEMAAHRKKAGEIVQRMQTLYLQTL